ncbi:beta-mannosidase-like isoform X2 [Dermacentor albipictus]|uniref:beta-mannosidase-like isoform X2 n=1 Tax=Dermacentor albipictus TaxID=60249 RepID=UPI0038FCE902
MGGGQSTTAMAVTISVPSNVPGGIYTDLKMAGVIDEPYYGENDLHYEWVALENWTFYRSFTLPTYIFGYRSIRLVAHGIDTVCTVTLNGVNVLKTENMFIRYEVGVRLVLRRNNSIVVSCQSPVLYALRKHEERTRVSSPVLPLCPPPIQRGHCHVNLIRKMPCSFSWDWGPSFPSTGIWKTIELEAYDRAVIRDVTVSTTPQRTAYGGLGWVINVGVFFKLAPRAPKHGTIFISLGDILLGSKTVILKKLKTRTQSFQELSGEVKISVVVPQAIEIDRWWPTGYGSQKLYQLNVTMSIDDELCDKMIKFGFRTVELQEDAIDGVDEGAKFYFRINGVPIFAKGSNWVPADIFPERVTEEYVRELLQSAKDANMNMIRVWGGGIYESDYFYDLADELGIMIWQDLMFCVSRYPADEAFLRSVAVEVHQQVRRLQRHPSLIVWVGNNENENGIYDDQWGYLSSVLDDYRKLYVYTIKRVIDREESSRPFLSSSPSNGRAGNPAFLNTSIPKNLTLSEEDIWPRGPPNSANYGDMHFYRYDNDIWDPTTYPIPRFMSEFGIQSYPSAETMRKVAPESALVYPFSPFLQYRQRHIGGNKELVRSLKHHFTIPTDEWNVNGTENGYSMISYLSQVAQAEGVRAGCESFRRWRSYLGPVGRGNTMGVLFWQLNEIWQAPSWSSIEYGGRWKMLHYFAKKFFSPVLVSPFIYGPDLCVFVVNDKLLPLHDVLLRILVYHWASFIPLRSVTVNLTVPAASSYDAAKIELGRLWKSSSCSRERCFLWFTLEDNSTGSLLAPDAYVLPAKPNRALLRPATIKVWSVAGPTSSDLEPDAYKYDVELRTDNVALFVWLDSRAVRGRFSDNGFLLKDPVKMVQFRTSEGVTSEQLHEAITIYTMSGANGNDLKRDSLVSQ